CFHAERTGDEYEPTECDHGQLGLAVWSDISGVPVDRRVLDGGVCVPLLRCTVAADGNRSSRPHGGHHGGGTMTCYRGRFWPLLMLLALPLCMAADSQPAPADPHQHLNEILERPMYRAWKLREQTSTHELKPPEAFGHWV